MTLLSSIALALLAALLAVLSERLIRQYLRKLKDDCGRIAAAREALAAQQKLLEALIDRENVPLSVKTFIVDLSAIVPDRELAYSIAGWINDGMRDKSDPDPEADAFFESLRTLRRTDMDSFELAVGAMRGAFVTMMLQWPATARSLQRLAHKLAAESANEVAKSAAAVHRVANIRHWITPDQALAA